MNYEQDIAIDETALEIEWLEQATLFMKYAKNAAEARRTLDQVKESLDIVKAEMDKKIREHPEKFKIEKVTEAVISAAILRSDEFSEANQKYIDAKYELDIAQAAVSAMNQRKEALENLVKLHGQSYFAGPKMPRDIHKEREKREELQKETNKRIASKLNRK